MRGEDKGFCVFVGGIVALFALFFLGVGYMTIDICTLESTDFARYCYELRGKLELEINTKGRISSLEPVSVYYPCGPVLNCDTSSCNDGLIQQDYFVIGEAYICIRETEDVYELKSMSISVYQLIKYLCVGYLSLYTFFVYRIFPRTQN